jgi:ProP effector
MTTPELNPTTVTAVIELLCERYPRTFFQYERRRVPLKVGIHRDILAELDGAVNELELSSALRVYTGNRVYRDRLRVGATRVGLNGEPAGSVTQEQARFAAKRNTAPPNPTPPAIKRLTLQDLKAAALKRKAGVS